VVVVEGLRKIFKLDLSGYNILKIKNLILISINLSFSKKLLF